MNEDGREWLGISDLMAGLMMAFLFIAVLLLVQNEREKIKLEESKQLVESIVKEHKNYNHELNQALKQTFENDLKKWNAVILDDNIIRFRGPEVLFPTGKSEITEHFELILSDFFPRYVRLLSEPRFKRQIDEIRIEGHTSSTWETATTLDKRYTANAGLSQRRALEVLKYCFGVDQRKQKKNCEIQDSEKEWLTVVLRANGMAFARPVQKRGKEDRKRSQRVEFRVKTKTEEQIDAILQALKGDDQ